MKEVKTKTDPRFELIRKFFMTHGRLPNYEELAKVCGVKSKNAAYKIANSCIDKGLLARDKSGRLSFAKPVLSELASTGSPKKDQEGEVKRGAAIPRISSGITVRMLGVVEAGFPSLAEEHTHDTITLDDYLIPHREASYMLKVKGNSMRDAGIIDGDMVIVERTNTAKPGDIVVARIDGEFTMKYYRIGVKAGRTAPYLEAANPDYKPMRPKHSLEVQAVVRSVVRTYGY